MRKFIFSLFLCSMMFGSTALAADVSMTPSPTADVQLTESVLQQNQKIDLQNLQKEMDAKILVIKKEYSSKMNIVKKVAKEKIQSARDLKKAQALEEKKKKAAVLLAEKKLVTDKKAADEKKKVVVLPKDTIKPVVENVKKITVYNRDLVMKSVEFSPGTDGNELFTATFTNLGPDESGYFDITFSPWDENGKFIPYGDIQKVDPNYVFKLKTDNQTVYENSSKLFSLKPNQIATFHGNIPSALLKQGAKKLLIALRYGDEGINELDVASNKLVSDIPTSNK